MNRDIDNEVLDLMAYFMEKSGDVDYLKVTRNTLGLPDEFPFTQDELIED